VQQETEQEKSLIRYLLGESSEEDKAKIEERFLIDGEFFEQVLAVEHALIDDYLEGRLAKEEMQKVEKLLISSPTQRRELEFVKALTDTLSKTGKDEQRLFREMAKPPMYPLPSGLSGAQNLGRQRVHASWIIVAFLCITGAISILIVQNKFRHLEAERVKREQEFYQQVDEKSERIEDLSRQLDAERNRGKQLQEEIVSLKQSNSSKHSVETLAFTLIGNQMVRGGGEWQTIQIPQNIQRLKISISLDSSVSYKSYSVTIMNLDGGKIWGQDDLRIKAANPARLSLILRSEELPIGDYTLVLRSRTHSGNSVDIGKYNFRVRR
jgi:hypothetical protein